jgi:hypothetical protein
MLPLLTALLLASSPPDCAALRGWDAGRGGIAALPACAEAPDYREAHRLGDALHALKRERDALHLRLARATPAERGALQRRQRQLDTDLEAIRGLATIKGWPLDPVQEPPP